MHIRIGPSQFYSRACHVPPIRKASLNLLALSGMPGQRLYQARDKGKKSGELKEGKPWQEEKNFISWSLLLNLPHLMRLEIFTLCASNTDTPHFDSNYFEVLLFRLHSILPYFDQHGQEKLLELLSAFDFSNAPASCRHSISLVTHVDSFTKLYPQLHISLSQAPLTRHLYCNYEEIAEWYIRRIWQLPSVVPPLMHFIKASQHYF